MKWYLLAFKKYVQFSGRSHRQEFWMYILFYILFALSVRVIDDIFGTTYNDARRMSGGLVTTLYSLVVFIPTIAITVRRLHDIGKSGWLYFWATFAAIVAFIAYFVFLVKLIISSGAGDIEALKAGEIDPTIFLTGNFLTYTALLGLFMLSIGTWLIVLLARIGNTGDNKYGPDPLAIPTE